MEQSGPISADLILISLSISLSRPSEIGAGAAVWVGGERWILSLIKGVVYKTKNKQKLCSNGLGMCSVGKVFA